MDSEDYGEYKEETYDMKGSDFNQSSRSNIQDEEEVEEEV